MSIKHLCHLKKVYSIQEKISLLNSPERKYARVVRRMDISIYQIISVEWVSVSGLYHVSMYLNSGWLLGNALIGYSNSDIFCNLPLCNVLRVCTQKSCNCWGNKLFKIIFLHYFISLFLYSLVNM